MPEAAPVIVETSRGWVEFDRQTPKKVRLVVESTTEDQSAEVENLARTIQRLCEQEIDEHVFAFRELETELLSMLSDIGHDVDIRFHDAEPRLRRQFDLDEQIGRIWIAGGRLRAKTTVLIDQETFRETHVASLVLNHILNERQNALRTLYQLITKKLQSKRYHM
jgi:hypothetical protein